MDITIENNKVIVNLDEAEVPAFQAMLARIQEDIGVAVEFREFGGADLSTTKILLPLHLCRVIGEANLSENPFATMSIYPFWKYGFAFGGDGKLALELGIDDPHKKAVVADEFGMGFCAWAMEELFHCEYWADASALIAEGMVVPTGSRRPDFVCTFPDGSLGIFEAKGTTGTAGNLSGALAEGKLQAQALTAQDPIKYRVVVGAALGGDTARVVLLDPPPSPPLGDRDDDSSLSGAEMSGVKTNLTAAMVAKAARRMRRTLPLNETEFRGPGLKIALVREDYKDDKRHGWLEIRA